MEGLLAFFSLVAIALIALSLYGINENRTINRINKIKEKELKALDIEKREKEVEKREQELKKHTETFDKEKKLFAECKKRFFDNHYAKVNEFNKNSKATVEKRAYDMLPDLKIMLMAEERALDNFKREIEPVINKKYYYLLDGIKAGRLHNSYEVNKDFTLSNLNFSLSAKITTKTVKGKEQKRTYDTTLTSCTCDDFLKNHIPACKHMLYLARTIGVLQIYRELHREEFDKVMKEVRERKSNKQSPSQRTKTTSLSAEN